MSKWWVIRNKKTGELVEVNSYQDGVVQQFKKIFEEIEVEIRPIDGRPCEWELQPDLICLKKHKNQGEACAKQWKYKYCPMCGRRLPQS